MNRKTLIVISYLGVFSTGFLLASPNLPNEKLFSKDGIDGTHNESAYIAATTQDGRGTVGRATVNIEPGKGKVLLETNPFIETDTQLSIKTARKVAETMTGKSLRDKNTIYSFSINGNYVGGPSAGAAMTLATIAAIDESRRMRDDVVITGTIEPDGGIGRVGSVPEKAFAAGRAGAEIFIVPEDQETFTYYREVLERQKSPLGFVYEDVRYKPEKISLDSITQEKYGMKTVGIRNIREAYEIALKG